MTIGLPETPYPANNELTIVFENSEPVFIEDVGAFLTALAQDYHRYSGRRLTIRSVRQGSLIFDIVDWGAKALVAMGAVVTLKDFVLFLKSLIEKAKNDPSTLEKRRSVGVKTVTEMITVSRKTHSNIHIVNEVDGNRTEVRLSRNEAEQLHLEQEAHRKRTSRAVSTPRQEMPASFERADEAIGDFARAAAEVSDDPKSLEEQGNPAFYLLKQLVNAFLELPGGKGRLDRIISDLRRQRQDAASQLLEALINQ